MSPSHWNHAAIFISPTTVVEARARGVVEWELAKETNWKEWVVYSPSYPSAQNRQNAILAALEGVKTHQRYNYLLILSEALRLALRAPIVFASSKGAICSGQVSHDLAEGGLDMGAFPEVNDPATLFAIGQSQKWQLVQTQM